MYLGSQASYQANPAAFDPYNISVSDLVVSESTDLTCDNLNKKNVNKTECKLTGLDDATNWYFSVTAVNSLNVQSARSNIRCKTFSGNCEILLPAIEALIR